MSVDSSRHLSRVSGGRGSMRRMTILDHLAHSLETPSFFVHLGSATRICQLLGFHRLGSDPHTMPRDVSGGAGDPAWPAQPCSLKREMAKRLWWYVTSMDWLFVTRTGMGQIPINSCERSPCS